MKNTLFKRLNHVSFIYWNTREFFPLLVPQGRLYIQYTKSLAGLEVAKYRVLDIINQTSFKMAVRGTEQIKKQIFNFVWPPPKKKYFKILIHYKYTVQTFEPCILPLLESQEIFSTSRPAGEAVYNLYKVPCRSKSG